MKSYLQVSIHALSKGMLHKVGIAITLLHDPPLLLLDEPTSGLDPLIRTQVRKILRDLTNDFEKTVVISSHILEDVEAVCDRVFFLEGGKMLHNPFWISELTQKVSELKRLEIRAEIPPKILCELAEQEEILYSEFNQISVDIYCQKNHVPNICSHLEDVLHRTIKYTTHPITLEDIYILNHANINWLEYIT
jgi:ABC-type multidrug transport system ATPase subunit